MKIIKGIIKLGLLVSLIFLIVNKEAREKVKQKIKDLG